MGIHTAHTNREYLQVIQSSALIVLQDKFQCHQIPISVYLVLLIFQDPQLTYKDSTIYAVQQLPPLHLTLLSLLVWRFYASVEVVS